MPFEGQEFSTRQQEAPENPEPELYTPAQMDAVERHIAAYFGDFPSVLHELVSPDVHVDVCIIPPADERGYYTLVTMGMGAHRMLVPEELAEQKLERAELLICLPPDWELDREEERWYWPVRLLKSLARLPGDCGTWLGWGHTVDNREPYAENTALCGCILAAPQNVPEDAETCPLDDGGEVNFYQVIPLYQEELEFKKEHDSGALLERMGGVSFIVDTGRPNVCGQDAGEADDVSCFIMDSMEPHLETIREKRLPVDEIAACNHLAIYLRWCMERDFMSSQFEERYPEMMEAVKRRGGVDLRAFLRDELEGMLLYPYFNDPGEAFARAYYNCDGDEPFYPADVDDYALDYFGAQRYHSDAFQDEAYLFIPYDEAYYQGMKAIIDRRWAEWRSGPDCQEPPFPVPAV